MIKEQIVRRAVNSLTFVPQNLYSLGSDYTLHLPPHLVDADLHKTLWAYEGEYPTVPLDGSFTEHRLNGFGGSIVELEEISQVLRSA